MGSQSPQTLGSGVHRAGTLEPPGCVPLCTRLSLAQNPTTKNVLFSCLVEKCLSDILSPRVLMEFGVSAGQRHSTKIHQTRFFLFFFSFTLRRPGDSRREFRPPKPRPTVPDGGVRLQLHTA